MYIQKEDQREATLEAFIEAIIASQGKRNQSKVQKKQADKRLKKNFVGVSLPPTAYRPGIAIGSISGIKDHSHPEKEGQCSEPTAIKELYRLADEKGFTFKGKPIRDFTPNEIGVITTREPCGKDFHNCIDFLSKANITDVSSLVDYNSKIKKEASVLANKIHSKSVQQAGRRKTGALDNYNIYVVNYYGQAKLVSGVKNKRANSIDPKKRHRQSVAKPRRSRSQRGYRM